MRKNYFKKITVSIIAAAMAGMMMTGCGSTFITNADINESAYEDEMEGAPYFTDGVYVNYVKGDEKSGSEEFFAFDGANFGHTINLAHGGAGKAFGIEQEEGAVVFTFDDEHDYQREFKVTSVSDSCVVGSFDDGVEIVFERLAGVNANDFMAEYSIDDGCCYAAVSAVDKDNLIMIANAQ